MAGAETAGLINYENSGPNKTTLDVSNLYLGQKIRPEGYKVTLNETNLPKFLASLKLNGADAAAAEANLDSMVKNANVRILKSGNANSELSEIKRLLQDCTNDINLCKQTLLKQLPPTTTDRVSAEVQSPGTRPLDTAPVITPVVASNNRGEGGRNSNGKVDGYLNKWYGKSEGELEKYGLALPPKK